MLHFQHELILLKQLQIDNETEYTQVIVIISNFSLCDIYKYYEIQLCTNINKLCKSKKTLANCHIFVGTADLTVQLVRDFGVARVKPGVDPALYRLPHA